MSIKRYDGSNWVEPSNIKRYDGSNWVDVDEIKRYDGSNWVSVYVNGTKYYLKIEGITYYSITREADGTIKFTGTTSSILASVEVCIDYTIPKSTQCQITATVANISNCPRLVFVVGGQSTEETLTTTATSYTTGSLTSKSEDSSPYIMPTTKRGSTLSVGSTISFTCRIDEIIVNNSSVPTPIIYDSSKNIKL